MSKKTSKHSAHEIEDELGSNIALLCSMATRSMTVAKAPVTVNKSSLTTPNKRNKLSKARSNKSKISVEKVSKVGDSESSNNNV